MALASPRTSAQIIPLPGAACAPVVNPPRPRGRSPKKITGIWRGKEIRAKRAWVAECERNTRDGAAELLRAALAHLEGGSHV